MSAGPTYPQRLIFIADLGVSYNRCALLRFPAGMLSCMCHALQMAHLPALSCLLRSTTTMEHVAISAAQSPSPTALFNIGDMCYAGEGGLPYHGAAQGWICWSLPKGASCDPADTINANGTYAQIPGQAGQVPYYIFGAGEGTSSNTYQVHLV